MRVLSLYNMKGGVGKTAAAVNLAHLAASQGLRTLLWDLDPQGATSFYLRVKPRLKGGSEKLLKNKSNLESRVKGTDYASLDLIPSDFSNRQIDMQLAEEKQSRLKKLLSTFAMDYSLVILDCPPSISELSEQVFRASDLVLVPIIPTVLSLRTLDQLLAFLKEQSIDAKVRAFFSMVDRRKNLHLETMADRSLTANLALNSYISYASQVERMGMERQPLTAFAPTSIPALQYRALWDEVQPILHQD